MVTVINQSEMRAWNSYLLHCFFFCFFSDSYLLTYFFEPAYPWGVAEAAAPVGASKHLDLLQQRIDALLGCQ